MSAYGAIGGGLEGLAEALQFLIGSRQRDAAQRTQDQELGLREMQIMSQALQTEADNRRQQEQQDFTQGMQLASNFPGQPASPDVAARLRSSPMTSTLVEDQMTLPARETVSGRDLGQSPTGQAMFATPESERFRIAQTQNAARLEQERIRAAGRAGELSQRLKTQLQIAGMTDSRTRAYHEQLADQFATRYAQMLRDADDRVWAQEMDNATRLYVAQLRGQQDQQDPLKAFLAQQLGDGRVPQAPPTAPPPTAPVAQPAPSRSASPSAKPAGRDPFGVR